MLIETYWYCIFLTSTNLTETLIWPAHVLAENNTLETPHVLMVNRIIAFEVVYMQSIQSLQYEEQIIENKNNHLFFNIKWTM